MPLNRLNVREIDYPQTDDALPMVTKLQYSERFDKAMRYIFGKTMICRNLEVASVLARTTGLDCVTLDGDQVSSKGKEVCGFTVALRSNCYSLLQDRLLAVMSTRHAVGLKCSRIARPSTHK